MHSSLHEAVATGNRCGGSLSFGCDMAEVTKMNQPIFRLAGFVVLAAIVLATGFGALG